MAAAPDLDELIAAHEAFLACVLRRALLDQDAEQAAAALRALVDNVLRLHGVVRGFVMTARAWSAA